MSKSPTFDSASGALYAPCRFSKGLLLLITLGLYSIVDLFWLVAIQCQASAEDLKQGHFGEVSYCLVLSWSLFFRSCLFSLFSFQQWLFLPQQMLPPGGVPANACHGATRAFNGFLLLPESRWSSWTFGRVAWQCAHQNLSP